MTGQDDSLVMLSNGAMADPGTGVIKVGAPLTSTQARALAHKRWDRARERIASGMALALDDISGVTEYDAAERIAEHFTRQALSRSDRAGVEYGKTVMRWADLVPDRQPGGNNGSQTVNNTLFLAADDNQLTSIIGKLRQIVNNNG